MTKAIVSTLGADNAYATFGDAPRRVVIRGCAGVRHVGRNSLHGVRTEVSDSDAEFLGNHAQFKQHQERGHVEIEDMAHDSDNERPD